MRGSFLLQPQNRARLRLAGALSTVLRHFYRLTFLVAASRAGLQVHWVAEHLKPNGMHWVSAKRCRASG